MASNTPNASASVRITIRIGVRNVSNCTATRASKAHTRCLRQTRINNGNNR
ncbi:hypothetical protein D3C78_1914640 [compost metagenome]